MTAPRRPVAPHETSEKVFQNGHRFVEHPNRPMACFYCRFPPDSPEAQQLCPVIGMAPQTTNDEDKVSRVDVERLPEGQDLPRKSQRGNP